MKADQVAPIVVAVCRLSGIFTGDGSPEEEVRICHVSTLVYRWFGSSYDVIMRLNNNTMKLNEILVQAFNIRDQMAAETGISSPVEDSIIRTAIHVHWGGNANHTNN